jgi:hypothetical protein
VRPRREPYRAVLVCVSRRVMEALPSLPDFPCLPFRAPRDLTRIDAWPDELRDALVYRLEGPRFPVVPPGAEPEVWDRGRLDLLELPTSAYGRLIIGLEPLESFP